MTTVAATPFGNDRTFSWALSRRAALWRSMMMERFSVWHRIEPRVDVWASAGALALAGASTALLFAARHF